MRCMVIWSTAVIFSIKAHNFEEDVINYKDRGFSSYRCDLKNEDGTDVHCYGKTLMEIPGNLSRSLRKLTVTDSHIKCITRSSFDPYRKEMRDVTLSNLYSLRVIEDGSFANMSDLRTLYISYSPQIKFLHGLLMGVTSSTFYSLRIVWTRLREIPDLGHLPANNTMFLLDMDHNHIEKIPANTFRLSAQQVTMNFNKITTVEDYAFNGSEIAELYMHSNYNLRNLGENAFNGLSSLRLLDLSSTSIDSLPMKGLQQLETLKIEGTPTMKTIPSIYDLNNLREARLTHSFHCCAFQYPAQHNPKKHAIFEENMKKICKELNQPQGLRSRRSLESGEWKYTTYNHSNSSKKKSDFPIYPNNIHNDMLVPLRGKAIDKEEARFTDDDFSDDEDEGFFHSEAADIDEQQLESHCDEIIFRIPEVECFPEPNALNPCEDIMGLSWLRISVWCVIVLAILGNLAVITVMVFGESEITVARFLICNLAFADFCMGLYLLLIASMDYHSVGAYFNFAYNWQYGMGCKIAGFLTVFSSHLSIYTLTIVTLERWFAITYALHLTKRISIRSAMYILFGGWIYSITVAALPILGVSNYSSTSICLPMETNELIDKAYLYTVIFINGFAFALIVFCYVQIYLSLGYETRRASTKGEMCIAKKMALLIFVDFATVAPIAFFGLTALAGYPLIGVTKSKILLVFFYPLNACANPYLYALMNGQYRRDLYMLVAWCGICKKKAENYRLSDSPMSHHVLKRSSNQHSNGTCTTRSNSNTGASYV
ncbi:unnamed protein product [Phaedon cochleariae]|uniref:G-protein coupled receptors family 1 profile domain-containing protein n=1 Tax=Phaedon cochleariae TaxID=80249 RepID=A0A9N9X250_PHACE|nr:unnamed protein product [Phaedon cochleariae]